MSSKQTKRGKQEPMYVGLHIRPMLDPYENKYRSSKSRLEYSRLAVRGAVKSDQNQSFKRRAQIVPRSV